MAALGARLRAEPHWNLDYTERKSKCHGGLYTLSESSVWISILLFNQLAEFWVAYFLVVYFPVKTLPARRSPPRVSGASLAVWKTCAFETCKEACPGAGQTNVVRRGARLGDEKAVERLLCIFFGVLIRSCSRLFPDLGNC